MKVARKTQSRNTANMVAERRLSSFPLILAVVLAEHGGRLSSVNRDRGLRIWNEREARRHECETRGW